MDVLATLNLVLGAIAALTGFALLVLLRRTRRWRLALARELPTLAAPFTCAAVGLAPVPFLLMMGLPSRTALAVGPHDVAVLVTGLTLGVTLFALGAILLAVRRIARLDR